MQITMKRDFPLQGFEPVKLLGLTCGERVNIVPDTAYAYFAGDLAKIKRQLEEIAGDDLEIDYYQDSYLQVKATGKSAHAMNPEKGINAMYKLLHYLAHPSLDYGSWELMLWIRQIAYLLNDESNGKSFNIDCYDDISGSLTINLGILRYKTEDLILKFDIRYPVTMNSSKIESKINIFVMIYYCLPAYNTRIEFRTQSIATPVSANTAIHILAKPMIRTMTGKQRPTAPRAFVPSPGILPI